MRWIHPLLPYLLAQQARHTSALASALSPRHYNPKLNTYNAFTVPVSEDIIDAATALFDSALRQEITAIDQKALEAQDLPCRVLATSSGRLFLIRHGVWHSDICWVSADDDVAFKQLESLFER